MALRFYSPLDVQGALTMGQVAVPDFAGIFQQQQQNALAQQKVDLVRQKQQAALDQEANYQRQVQDLLADPSPDKINAFALRNPDVAEKVKAAFELKDKQTQERDFQEMSGLYRLALQDPKAAGQRMMERYKTTGDPDDLRAAQGLLADDPDAVRGTLADLGMHVQAIHGDAKDFANAYKQFYLPDYEKVGDFYINKNTGEVFQSPYAKVEGTPAGFWQYGPVGGMAVFGRGGGGTDLGSAVGGTPPIRGTPSNSAGVDAADPDAVWNGMIGNESNHQHFDATGKVQRSKKGALGIAQVMPKTGPEAARLAGEEWSLKRLTTDPEYNARLGRAYYGKQLKDFGNPIKAAAAYNAGPTAMRRALKRGGESGWINFLPKETREYVANLTGGVQQADPNRVRADAQAAIAAGADPAKVRAEARKMGVQI